MSLHRLIEKPELMTKDALAAFNHAAGAPNLNAAMAELKANLNPIAWWAYRGGSHIALHTIASLNPMKAGPRVAMIADKEISPAPMGVK